MTSRAERIMAECADRRGMTVDDMLSARIIKKKSVARQIAAYRLRMECCMSSAQIARRIRIWDADKVDVMIDRHRKRLERITSVLRPSQSDASTKRAAEKEAAAINKYWRARGTDAQAHVVRTWRGEYVVRSNLNFGAKAAA